MHVVQHMVFGKRTRGINTHYWPSVKWSIWLNVIVWPNSFFCILLVFLKFLNTFPGWLFHETSSFARPLRNLMHWGSLRSLLRTYERSNCSKSSILFTDTKFGPIYGTCTSPIMHLICRPKFCISIIFNFSWHGCNIQKKWKTPWKVMQTFGGQIRYIMGDVQATNPAILTKQAWSIKDLFYCQIIVVLIHNGFSCCYLVFYE